MMQFFWMRHFLKFSTTVVSIWKTLQMLISKTNCLPKGASFGFYSCWIGKFDFLKEVEISWCFIQGNFCCQQCMTYSWREEKSMTSDDLCKKHLWIVVKSSTIHFFTLLFLTSHYLESFIKSLRLSGKNGP